MKNKNDDEYSHKLSYRIAHLIGAVVVKLIQLIRKSNLRLVLGIPAVAMLLLVVYGEFFQNQDRNNELLYNALIPGKSTRDDFNAFKRSHDISDEPNWKWNGYLVDLYWNGYLVEFVKPQYKPESRFDGFIIYLLRDPGNTKGISFETLKSDLEYLCGTKWYESGTDGVNNIGQYELKHENFCSIQRNDFNKDWEYLVYVERSGRIN